MKSKSAKKLRFGILFSILAVGILFLVNEELTGNPLQGAGKTFSLPVFDAFTDVGGSQIDVKCNIKQTTTIVDGSGNIIKELQSTGISGSPSFLNIVNPANNAQEVSVFVIIPKISCNVQGADITIEKSSLTLTARIGVPVYQDSLRYQADISFPATSGGFQTERNLGWFSLSDNDIEAQIPEEDATRTLVFDVTGNVDIHYDQFPTNTMTIPINQGDLQTSWTFTNIGVNETIVDTDGDGIKDNADACPSTKETFNGYNDSDGCPDTVPSTTTEPTPTPEPTVVTKLTCNADNKTWYTYTNASSESCSTAYKLADNTLCKEYDMTGKSCVDPISTSGSTPDTIDAKVKFQVDIKMTPTGLESFQVADDPSPLEVNIPLNALTGSVSGATKRTAEFNVEPRIVFTNSQFFKLVSVVKSNITIEPIVTVKTVDYSLGAKPINFVNSGSGGSGDITLGLSLGDITVKAFDLENKVPTSVIPLGSSANADVRFLVNGDITLRGGDGTFTERVVDVSGADFQITGLTITRSDSTSTPSNTVNCDPATENQITISGINSCIPKGTTSGTVAPKIGDDKVLICTDGSIFDGGFPCTEDYRIAYCGGADSTDCSKPTTSTGDGNIVPPVITPIDTTVCPTSGLQSLSLSDNACVIFGDNTNTNSGKSVSPTSTSDPNLIWYGAIGILVIGLIIFAVKRKA